MLSAVPPGTAAASRVDDCSANWIWANVQHHTPFQYVAFRKEFDLRQIPERAEALITADTFYRLWINGSLVMHGPARSSAGRATLDSLDVRRFLKLGRNVIEVRCVYGAFIFDALAQSPGFLCEFRFSDASKQWKIVTDADWSSCELLGWNRESPKFSFQRGWVEDVDGRLDNDLIWKPSVVLGPVGTAPWKSLKLRDVSLPANLKDVRPTSVLGAFRSLPTESVKPGEKEEPLSFAQGASVLPRSHWASRLQVESVKTDHTAATGAENILNGRHGSVVLHGRDSEVAYDFGQSYVGFLGFEVSGKVGDVLEIAWNEQLSLRDNIPRPADGVATIAAARYTLHDGTQRFLSFCPQLVHFVRIVNRSGGELKVSSLSVKEYRFGGQDNGAFSCSDPDLNDIYRAAKRTALLSTLDVFMDCPSRERGAWLHDSYWTAQAVRSMYGDTNVNRRMCRLVAESEDDPNHVGPKGIVHPLYPSDISAFRVILPCHSLFWIMQIGLDDRFTGDSEFTREMLPYVRRCLAGFDGWRTREGLLDIPGSSESAGIWNFLDWATIRTDGCSIGTNSIYVAALRETARMERLAGDRRRAEEYSKRADQVTEAINRYCGDGLFYPDTLLRDSQGRLVPSTQMCESTQYLAMWSGVPSQERSSRMWGRLRDGFASNPSDGTPIDGLTRCGIFAFLERLQIEERLGEHSALLRDIKSMFLPMAHTQPGTFWEYPGRVASLCHGFGSYAASSVTSVFLGINDGNEIVIAPHDGGSLTWAKGRVPTSVGVVNVDWKESPNRYVLKVEVPDGKAAKVVLPEEAKRIWSAVQSKSKWKDSISVTGRSKITICPGTVRISDI